MKTIKKVIPFIFILTLLISGCSGQSDTIQIDTKAMVNDLLEKIEFEDELNAVDDDTTIKMLYDIDNAVEANVYISSGATAEEIAVFKFEDKKAAEEGKEKVLERISVQKENFATYIPEEVKKLDNAVVKQTGNYVAICVSDSNEAEKIIKEHMD